MIASMIWLLAFVIVEIDWLIGWLSTDWLIVGLDDWLTDLMIDWLITSLSIVVILFLYSAGCYGKNFGPKGFGYGIGGGALTNTGQ